MGSPNCLFSIQAGVWNKYNSINYKQASFNMIYKLMLDCLFLGTIAILHIASLYGKDIRIVLPSCVVIKIREEFPSGLTIIILICD